MIITRYSPAKINLILSVLRKREDGYHDIASLMQKISLYDEMKFSLKGDSIVVKCPGSLLPENKDNIIYMAAEALFSYSASSFGVEIIVHKKIPVAAGLGGGSSDAATTIMTLNEMTGLNLKREELMEIGSKIGADVPFFIFGNNTAWAFGIGDVLQPAAGLPRMWFVLVNPGFEISTKKIYESLKLGLTNDIRKYNIPRLESLHGIGESLYNDLEKISLSCYPVLSKIKEILIAVGAIGSLMSGSGPTVFGIFGDKEEALMAKAELLKTGLGTVFVAHSV